MTEKDIRAAYQQKPIPDGAPRVPYILLRCMYHGYRAGNISRDEGEGIKAAVLDYNRLPAKERLSLLRYALALLEERGRCGELSAREDGKELVREIARKDTKGFTLP